MNWIFLCQRKLIEITIGFGIPIRIKYYQILPTIADTWIQHSRKTTISRCIRNKISALNRHISILPFVHRLYWNNTRWNNVRGHWVSKSQKMSAIRKSELLLSLSSTFSSSSFHGRRSKTFSNRSIWNCWTQAALVSLLCITSANRTFVIVGKISIRLPAAIVALFRN